MPFTSLKLRPGIDVEQSPQLNEAGFSASTCVRFFENMVQKVGGFTHVNSTLLTGTATGMHGWSDIAGNKYIAVGTDQWLELFYGGTLFNITPLRATTNANPDFSTIATSATVTITDNANGVQVGDWVIVYVPVSIGGIVLQGPYEVQSIVDSNNYTITAATSATGTISNGGAVPEFTTVNTQPTVTVTLDNHGLTVGSVFTVQIATTVGGITIAAGLYSVASPTTNTFVITPGGVATGSTSAFENNGHAQLQYQIHSGIASAMPSSGAWGGGDWGGGQWGGGNGATQIIPLRLWFLDNFGQDLIGNYTGSPLYLWAPPATVNSQTLTDNQAIPINTSTFPDATSPPQTVNTSFLSAPQEMIIALGCDPPMGGTQQPLLVRWCDAGDFTDWVATTTNQAGSYSIPSGSMLVGGLSAPNFTVIWTDIDLWLMNYLGGTGLSELVWGFTKVAGGAGLLSAKSCALYKNYVFWASPNGFYRFDGNSIQIVPCPVWDIFWFNLNQLQVEKVNAQVNSWFQEISWAFPSASGTGEVDSRVTYNIRENTWTYDLAVSVMARTAWIDDNVYGAPIGTDNAGLMQQHEVSNDADGAPLISWATSGWFSMQEGTLLTFIERLVADFIVTDGAQTVYVTIYVQDWPTDTITTFGPYAWTAGEGPNYSVVHARGRYAQVKIGSTGLGCFWRLGNVRFLTSQAGRR